MLVLATQGAHQITRAVTQDGAARATQSGEYQLPFLAIPNGLVSLELNDFGQIAFENDAQTTLPSRRLVGNGAYLRHAVMVEDLHPTPPCANGFPHARRAAPGFAGDDDFLQCGRGEVDAPFACRLDQAKGISRRAEKVFHLVIKDGSQA